MDTSARMCCSAAVMVDSWHTQAYIARKLAVCADYTKTNDAQHAYFCVWTINAKKRDEENL